MRKNMFNKNLIGIVTVVAFSVALSLPLGALAATFPSLGTADPFAILSDTFTSNVGITGITGNVGYTTLSGSGSNTIAGTTYTPAPPQTGLDQTTALTNINNQASISCTDITGQGPLEGVVIGVNPPGTFPPGCYKSTGAMNITANGIVTLSGVGTYIFKPAGAITTGANSVVRLTNGASACDVFWAPVGATTIGANAIATTTPTFVGNIFRGDASGLSITLGHFANLLGRALAYGSTVTTDTNTIATPSCGVPAPGNLHIVKNVVGGTAVPSDFNIHVKLSGSDVAGSPTVGTTTPGTLYLLTANTYSVSEDFVASYTSTYGTDCDANGNVALPAGGNKTCTITNIYTQPTVSYHSSGGGSIVSSVAASSSLPKIGINKVASSYLLPVGSSTVAYNYTVWNVGKQLALTNVTVTDDKCSGVKFISGDTNNNGKIDANENWIYSCTTKLSKTTTNTAVATGYGDDSNHLITTATSTVTVRVSVPGLPNTGIPPQEGSNTLMVAIFASILSISFLSCIYIVYRKRIS